MVYVLIIHPINMLFLIKDEYISSKIRWKVSKFSDGGIVFINSILNLMHLLEIYIKWMISLYLHYVVNMGAKLK